MPHLPKDSPSQEIGRLASRALAPNLPRSWIEKELDGDSDFGIDYIVQLKSKEDFVSFSFYLQLKGTTSPDFTSGYGHIRYDLKVSTLRYYLQQEPLVMVAVVDLSGNEDNLSDCPIYYIWIDEDWYSDREKKLNEQDWISLRIPTTQRLTTSLDVYEFYAQRFSEKLAINDLKKGIKQSDRGVLEGITSITKALESKPIYLKSFDEKSDAPWIDNPCGTCANLLKRCSDSLSSNKLSLARRTLEEIEEKTEALSENERAEMYFQWANLHQLSGHYDESARCYEAAFKTDSKDRYLLGYLESKFRSDSLPDKGELHSIIDSLSNDSYQKCFLKAKCISILGSPEEALTLLRENYPKNVIGQMVLLTLGRLTSELDHIIEDYRHYKFETVKEAFLFHSLSARRYFYRATSCEIVGEEMLPIQGKSTYNIELMKGAFELTKLAWRDAKEIGYPSDVIYMLDVSVLTYGYFDALDDLTSHIEEMLSERPNNPDLVRRYSRILFKEGNWDRVVELINRLDDPDADDVGIIILSYYYLDRPTRTLDIIKEYEHLLLSGTDRNIGLIFCIGAQIARDTFDNSLAERYERIVDDQPDGKAVFAIQKFFNLCNSDPSHRETYVQDLYKTYIALDRPTLIADQMFRFLDSYEERFAKQVIEVGQDLLGVRELTNLDYCHLGQAFLTTGQWPEAERLARLNLKKGVDTPRWNLILAAAQQYQGDVGVAYTTIKDVVKSTNATKEQQIFYINLCLSLGLVKNTAAVVKELIASTSARKDKIQLLITLISIYTYDNGYQDDLKLAIEKFGQLVDQTDCEEEGQYLMYMLTAPGKDLEKEEILAFQSRLATYTERFPESTLLRQGYVNTEDGPEELIRSMRKVVGITDDQLRRWERNKIAIRNGSFPVPFCLLANFLGDTRDVFTTWALSLSCPEGQLEYRIRHSPQCPIEKFEKSVNCSDLILIEVTSLLVLSELDMLDPFLDAVPKFSVIGSVFDDIARLSHPLAGTMFGVYPRKILEILQNNLEKINVLRGDGINEIEEYTQALTGKGGLFISEDLYLEKYLRVPNESVTCGNVFNVIEYLMEKGRISSEEYYHKVSEVFKLGIDVPNLRLGTLAYVFKHYVDVVGSVDYSETRFSQIFNKVFEVHRDSEFCLDLLFRFLDCSLEIMNIRVRTLADLFKGFLIRHPVKSYNSIVALWFVYRCRQNEPDTKSLVGRSEIHWNQWIEYTQLMAAGGQERRSFEYVVRNLVEELFLMDDQERSLAYTATKSCFVPMTYESETFEKIYQQFSLNEKVLNSQS